MTAEVARMDLRLRRRVALGCSVGFAAYALLIVVLYPNFRHDTSLDALTRDNATLSALFGATGSLTTPAGWMNANLYGNFVPLFALLLTIGYGAWGLAGQDEENLLGNLAALPISRTRLLAEKVTALAVLAIPIALVTLGCGLLGPAFSLHLDRGALAGATLAVILLALDFGLLALAVGAWTGRRGLSLATAVAVAATSYVVSSLAAAVHWVHTIRFLSPFYWSVGDEQISRGLQAAQAAALILTGAALTALAYAGLRRLDIH